MISSGAMKRHADFSQCICCVILALAHLTDSSGSGEVFLFHILVNQ